MARTTPRPGLKAPSSRSEGRSAARAIRAGTAQVPGRIDRSTQRNPLPLVPTAWGLVLIAKVALEKNGDKPLMTPLRLSLKPGQYKITYTHPAWNEGSRIKEVTVVAGETTYESDSQGEAFIDEAIKHFLVTEEELPPGEDK